MISAQEDPKFDAVIGPVESMPVEEPVFEQGEIDAGVVAAILLGLFVAYLGLRYWVEHRYNLVYALPRRDPLDLRPVVIAYGVLSAFLLATASRFSRWFAPAGVGQRARIVLAAIAILVLTESFQPLAILRCGFDPSGRWGNVFSGMSSPQVAAYLPLVLGVVLALIARVFPKVVLPAEPSPSDNGSTPAS